MKPIVIGCMQLETSAKLPWRFRRPPAMDTGWRSAGVVHSPEQSYSIQDVVRRPLASWLCFARQTPVPVESVCDAWIE